MATKRVRKKLRLLPNGKPKLDRKDQREADIDWARVAKPPSPTAYVARFHGSYVNACKRVRAAGVEKVDGRHWVFKGEDLDACAEAARVELRELIDRYVWPNGIVPLTDRIVLKVKGRQQFTSMLAETLYVAWHPTVLCVIEGQGGVVAEVRPEDLARVLAWLKGERYPAEDGPAGEESAESTPETAKSAATDADPGTEVLPAPPSSSEGVGDVHDHDDATT
jgi:hypothetical protein